MSVSGRSQGPRLLWEAVAFGSGSVTGPVFCKMRWKLVWGHRARGGNGEVERALVGIAVCSVEAGSSRKRGPRQLGQCGLRDEKSMSILEPLGVAGERTSAAGHVFGGAWRWVLSTRFRLPLRGDVEMQAQLQATGGLPWLAALLGTGIGGPAGETVVSALLACSPGVQPGAERMGEAGQRGVLGARQTPRRYVPSTGVPCPSITPAQSPRLRHSSSPEHPSPLLRCH